MAVTTQTIKKGRPNVILCRISSQARVEPANMWSNKLQYEFPPITLYWCRYWTDVTLTYSCGTQSDTVLRCKLYLAPETGFPRITGIRSIVDTYKDRIWFSNVPCLLEQHHMWEDEALQILILLMDPLHISYVFNSPFDVPFISAKKEQELQELW